MARKALLVLLVAGLLAGSMLPAQTTDARLKATMLKRIGAVAWVMRPNLQPALWIDCGCANLLDGPGYMLVSKITVNVYNAGGAASNTATGKIEFFDELSNQNVTRNFTVQPAAPKSWPDVSPRHFVLAEGAWLVKKSAGIKVSVTFTGPGQATPKTNTRVENACSVVY